MLSCSRARIRSVVHNLDAATLTLEITRILWVPAQKGSFGCNVDSILGPFSNSYSRDCPNILNFCPKCLWDYQETAPTSHSAGKFFSDKHGMPLNCICQKFSGFLYTKLSTGICIFGNASSQTPVSSPYLVSIKNQQHRSPNSLHKLWLASVIDRRFYTCRIILRGITSFPSWEQKSSSVTLSELNRNDRVLLQWASSSPWAHLSAPPHWALVCTEDDFRARFIHMFTCLRATEPTGAVPYARN